MRFIPLVIASIVLLSSCEGGTDRFYRIQNDSSGPLEVKVYRTGADDQQYSVASASVEEVIYATQLGGSDYVDIPIAGLDSLVITNADGLVSTKSVDSKDDWKIEVKEERRIPSHYVHKYTLTITNSDFD